MEVCEGLGHLTKDERFLMKGELLLAVILQVRAKTGVHLLHHEHRQARSSLHIHPQELDDAGVTQLRPRQALRLEVADQFRYSAGRFVFKQDLMQTFGGAHSPVPVHFIHGRICASSQFDISKHYVHDDEAGESGAGR